jgi:Ca2+-binding EF-hand superfamily protein
LKEKKLKLTKKKLIKMSSQQENNYLRAAFVAMDKNKDGFIDRNELDSFLDSSGYTRQEGDELFKLVDVDGDGRININEFIRGFAPGNQ